MINLSPPPSMINFVKLLNDKVSNSREWITWLNSVYKLFKTEAWHEVGSTGEPAFQNSWANVGGANDETLAYRLDGLGELRLKGYIDSGTTADGTVVFTLPEAYRPTKTIRCAAMFVQGSTENSYQIEIQTDGDVAIYGVSGASPSLSMNIIVDIDNG